MNDPEGTVARRRGWWDRFESGPILNLAAVLFITATFVMLTEGLNRSFRDISFFWAEELVRYLMIWAFFLTLGVAGSHGHHIRTDLLVAAVPPKVRRSMYYASVIAGIVFSVVLLGSSIPQLVRYYTMGMVSDSNLDTPLWIIFLAMPLGALLLGGYYLRSLLVLMRGGDPFSWGGSTASERQP